MSTSCGGSVANICRGSAVNARRDVQLTRAAAVLQLTQGPMLAQEPTAHAGSAAETGWSASRVALPVLMGLFGFALRVLYLNHESVSGDEAFSMSVSQLPLKEMLAALVQDFVHPPLHYFVLR